MVDVQLGSIYASDLMLCSIIILQTYGLIADSRFSGVSPIYHLKLCYKKTKFIASNSKNKIRLYLFQFVFNPLNVSITLI